MRWVACAAVASALIAGGCGGEEQTIDEDLPLESRCGAQLPKLDVPQPLVRQASAQRVTKANGFSEPDGYVTYAVIEDRSLRFAPNGGPTCDVDVRGDQVRVRFREDPIGSDVAPMVVFVTIAESDAVRTLIVDDRVYPIEG
jgi:hypothetical protein